MSSKSLAQKSSKSSLKSVCSTHSLTRLIRAGIRRAQSLPIVSHPPPPPPPLPRKPISAPMPLARPSGFRRFVNSPYVSPVDGTQSGQFVLLSFSHSRSSSGTTSSSVPLDIFEPRPPSPSEVFEPRPPSPSAVFEPRPPSPSALFEPRPPSPGTRPIPLSNAHAIFEPRPPSPSFIQPHSPSPSPASSEDFDPYTNAPFRFAHHLTSSPAPAPSPAASSPYRPYRPSDYAACNMLFAHVPRRDLRMRRMHSASTLDLSPSVPSDTLLSLRPLSPVPEGPPFSPIPNFP